MALLELACCTRRPFTPNTVEDGSSNSAGQLQQSKPKQQLPPYLCSIAVVHIEIKDCDALDVLPVHVHGVRRRKRHIVEQAEAVAAGGILDGRDHTTRTCTWVNQHRLVERCCFQRSRMQSHGTSSVV